jgi:hypothetical protein
MKLVSVLAVILFAACSPDDHPAGDGGTDGGGAGIDENYCIGHGVKRVLVEDTRGFCLTFEEVDDSCETVEDCIGYRIPVPWQCCSDDPNAKELDCAFANRDFFPDCPECSADEACRKAPRACREGRCVADLPDDACETDYDCTLIETGCACTPASKSVVDYQPVYGMDCTGLRACPQPESDYSICVDGRCYFVGPFMNYAMEKFCSLCGNPDDPESCSESVSTMEYEDVAKFWPMYQAILLTNTCWAFFGGPGKNVFYCLSVLCP